jgi:hypothetical protein
MPSKKKKLNDFEGIPVATVGLEIRNAAGGLNEAMKVDPEEWHHKEEIYVVLRCEVSKIRHDPIKDLDSLRRVHILTASDAAVVDGALVAEALDAQAQRIEQASGIHRFPDDPIAQAHVRGEHGAELVDGCVECDRERDLVAAGK